LKEEYRPCVGWTASSRGERAAAKFPMPISDQDHCLVGMLDDPLNLLIPVGRLAPRSENAPRPLIARASTDGVLGERRTSGASCVFALRIATASPGRSSRANGSVNFNRLLEIMEVELAFAAAEHVKKQRLERSAEVVPAGIDDARTHEPPAPTHDGA
jgi:hypothetical protein